jgi:hypothetical protein
MATEATLAHDRLSSQISAFVDYVDRHLFVVPQGPTLAEQLDDLDEVRSAGDLGKYVAAWLAKSDENGAAAFVTWRPGSTAGAEPWVILGFATDSRHGNRRLRHEALEEHAEGIPGFREALIAHLMLIGRICDNRVRT